jgi:hypothetical protein
MSKCALCNKDTTYMICNPHEVDGKACKLQQRVNKFTWSRMRSADGWMCARNHILKTEPDENGFAHTLCGQWKRISCMDANKHVRHCSKCLKIAELKANGFLEEEV